MAKEKSALSEFLEQVPSGYDIASSPWKITIEIDGLPISIMVIFHDDASYLWK